MTNVVLVDDEEIVRKGISLSIEWENYGVKIVGEAPNGQEALKKCLECRPDIVITDIRMPQMDGLELAGRLREIMPGTKVIILSGYEDFSYAKRAIVLGVREYLLKPVNEEELVSAVKKLQKQIKEEYEADRSKKNSELLLNQNMMDIRSKFVRKIFEREWNTKEEILEEAGKRKIDIRGNRYGVFLVRMDQEYLWSEKSGEFNRDLYRFSICNIGDEILTERVGKGILTFYENMDFAGILCMEYLERYSMTDILKEMQDKIRKYLKIKVSIGVGNIYRDLVKIGRSFNEAEKALKQKFYAGPLKIHFFSETEEEVYKDMEYPIKEEHEAVKCQRNKDEQGMSLILKQIFESFKKSRPEESKAKDDCCRFANILIQCAVEEGVDIAKTLGKDFNAYAAIQRLETLGEIQEWMEGLARHLRLGIEQSESSRYSIQVTNAMRYMKANYQREITLLELSGIAGISPNYLSRLFKEETGINFVDWLNKLRIEKAVQMMEDSTMKIYEIAEKAGFSDYKYFSSIFKKVTGKTPKQFQKR